MPGFRRSVGFSLPVLLLALASCETDGEEIGDLTADEVLQEAAEREEARVEGVSGLRIEQETFGMAQILRFRRVEEDGWAGFRLVGVTMGGMVMPADQVETPGSAGSARMFASLIGRAELVRVDRDSERRRVAVLHVADPGEIEGLTDMSLRGGDDEPHLAYDELEIRVDLDEYLLRRVDSRLHLRDTAGEVHRVAMSMRLEDYRDVEGVRYPFRTVMRMDGLPRPSGEERDAALDQISTLRAQLEQVPAQHRAEAERFIGSQVRVMEQTMEGYMELEVVARSLEVERD